MENSSVAEWEIFEKLLKERRELGEKEDKKPASILAKNSREEIMAPFSFCLTPLLLRFNQPLIEKAAKIISFLLRDQYRTSIFKKVNRLTEQVLQGSQSLQSRVQDLYTFVKDRSVSQEVLLEWDSEEYNKSFLLKQRRIVNFSQMFLDGVSDTIAPLDWKFIRSELADLTRPSWVREIGFYHRKEPPCWLSLPLCTGGTFLVVEVGPVKVEIPNREKVLDLGNLCGTISWYPSGDMRGMWWSPRNPVWDRRSRFFHPHISDNSLCLGDALGFIGNNLSAGLIGEVYKVCWDLLTHYNSESPYCSIEEWEAVSLSGGVTLYCENCETELSSGSDGDSEEDPRYYCTTCEAILCEDCVTFVENNDNPYCSAHVTSCSDCGEDFPVSCGTFCERCEVDFCTSCGGEHLHYCELCGMEYCADDTHVTWICSSCHTIICREDEEEPDAIGDSGDLICTECKNKD